MFVNSSKLVKYGIREFSVPAGSRLICAVADRKLNAESKTLKAVWLDA